MSIASLAPNRSHIATALDRLARLNREAEARFRNAADRASIDALREVLGRWARERARFAHELEIEAQAVGDRPPWAAASASRVRAIEERGDVQRVEACRAAEEAGLREYERVLLLALPVEIERQLRGHYSAIKDAIDRLLQIAKGIV
jgi:hypothetical protein